MKKDTYLRKLQSTKIVDTMTVAEAKKARSAQKALRRFWEKAALSYARDKGQIKDPANMYIYKFAYNLNPTGSVRIEVWFSPSGFGDPGAMRQSDELVKQVTVRKRDLFT